MRAWVVREHGGPVALKLEPDFPEPQPGPGDVVVQVRAVGLNAHDVFLRGGMPGVRLPLPLVPGLDVAGEILALGAEVTGWNPGQRVLVDPIDRAEGGLLAETRPGGLAERLRVPAHQLLALPDGVTFEQAACLPVGYGTALRMLRTIAEVQPGELVLVLGAAGGVGLPALLVARHLGARVIGCAGSETRLKRLAELGADETINEAQDDFMRVVQERHGRPQRRAAAGGVDVVVNFLGGETWVPSLRCLKRGGRLVTCGAAAGHAPQEDLRFIWTFELKILGSNGWERQDLEDLVALVAEGRLKPPVAGVFPLAGAREALQRLEDRDAIGSLLVTP